MLYLIWGSLSLLLNPSASYSADGKLVTELRDYVFQEAGKVGAKASIGIMVIGLDDGQVIHAENEDRLFVPASLQKLLLTLTSLKLLGGQYRFPLEVYVDNLPKTVDPEEKERVDFQAPLKSVGSLYIRGYGDPTIDSLRLLDISQALIQYGVTKVENVIIDDTLFLAPKPASGPKPSEAGSSAVSVNYNSFAVYVAPGRAAAPAYVSLTPGLPFALSNKVLTMRGREQLITIDTAPSGLQSGMPGADLTAETRNEANVLVRGTMGSDADALVLWQSLPDIGAGFRNLLRYAFKLAGLEVAGIIRKGEVPPQAALLESFTSKSLAEILRDMNQQSNNMIANQVAFAIGQDDKGYFNFDLGVRRLQSQLQQLVEKKYQNFVLADASGFNRGNRMSPRHVSAVLAEAGKDFAILPEFVSSLGHFGGIGTLRNRILLSNDSANKLRGEELRRSRNRAQSVWAKTGTLDGVSGLAGFAVTKLGQRVAFVLMEEGVKDKVSASNFEDGFLRVLVGLTSEASETDIPLG